jgi:hypothetical protein
LINIYAPTKDDHKAQNEFFCSLETTLDHYIDTNIIIGGDFNTCLNPEIDKIGGVKEKCSNTAKQIINMADKNDMVDVWRLLNENEKRFTWRNTTRMGRVSSRLDYWLISSHLLFNVEKADIEPAIKTDHSLIKLVLLLPNTPRRGKGFWKFNNSLLTDKAYTELIETFFENYVDTYNEISNKSLAWDALKCKLRGITIDYSIKIAKKKRQYVNDLNIQLQDLETRLDNNENVIDMYNSVRKDLEQVEEETLRGSMIRARAQGVEEGEKCSKYFMKLENRNYKSKCITTIVNNDETINCQSKILNECKNFYEALYSTSRTENNLSHCEFFNNITNKLDEEKHDICESEITEEEYLNSIMSFSNNKSPGCDGFTIEFYKCFWPNLKTYLMKSYEYSFENNLLSVDQRRALITLIPKANKDKRFLKHWRPISLLNVDYKIFAKLLASRLQKVISGIINENQTGYIKGRYIGDNIRTMLDILDITQNQHDPGLLVMIDFEKAFDTISWEFLYKTLDYFNFGPIFKSYIKLLYTSPQCCVTNNGYHTEFFEMKRGIRQGCPISALLFILCVEVLAINVRSTESIRGIKLKNKEIKITQFADDTCLYLNGVNSLENAVKVFEDFYRYAGLKLNIEKTEIIWLGKNNRIGKILDIKITQNPVKILGVWMCKNPSETITINFEERVNKFKALIDSWSYRNITIKGKITLLKAKALPLIMYVCNFLYVPQEIIKSIEKIMYDFIWNSKHHVKKITLIQGITDGGLKMPDFAALVKANKLNFIKRIIDVNSNCNKTATVILKTADVERFLMYKNKTQYLHTLPKFYEQLLDIWYSFQNKDPVSTCDILYESLWYNMSILIGNKPIYNKTWFNAGIKYIKDIFNGGRFLS